MFSAVVGALALPFVAALPAIAQDAQPIQGFVADAATLQLLPAATVMLVSTGDVTQSGPDGGFTFSEVPLGRITVAKRWSARTFGCQSSPSRR